MAGDERGDPVEPSKSRLDKLGDRLRTGESDEADLRALDSYRRSFRTAYDNVAKVLKDQLGLEATGRPAKTTTAIVEKLRRQKIRLTQMQDIAGLRLLVEDVIHQDEVVRELVRLFPNNNLDDRREKPSYGYQAVHVIVGFESKVVEVQVRTREQHRWALVSEKLADVVDPTVKYGGGPQEIREALISYSEIVKSWEDLERIHRQMLELATKDRKMASGWGVDSPEGQKLLAGAKELEEQVKRTREGSSADLQRIADLLLRALAGLEGGKS